MIFRPASISIASFVSLALFCFLFFFLLTGNIQEALRWEMVWRYRAVFFQGWLETVLIALAALGLSSLLGSFIVAVRRSSFITLRLVAHGLVEIIRGTPLLTQILFFFYVVAHNVGFENRFIIGIFILSLFSSAYISEMIRGGIMAIPLTQWESAKMLGFSRLQTYRYVVIPQVFQHLAPALTGQLASLIKDSSLLSIIGIREFTMAAQQVNSTTYCTLESYFPLAFGYLLLTLPLSFACRWLEKKLAS